MGNGYFNFLFLVEINVLFYDDCREAYSFYRPSGAPVSSSVVIYIINNDLSIGVFFIFSLKLFSRSLLVKWLLIMFINFQLFFNYFMLICKAGDQEVDYDQDR